MEAMPDTNSHPKPRRRACDACKARKVKCNGELSCNQCSHLNLRCSYGGPTKERKNVQRGRLVKQWMNGREDSELQNPPVVSPTSPDGLTRTLTNASVQSQTDTSHLPADPDFFKSFLADFEQYVYPFHPIFSPREAERAIDGMAASQDLEAFVYALVAVTINFTSTRPIQPGSDVAGRFDYWITKALQTLRPLTNTEEDITPMRVITVQWMHVCFMGLQKFDLGYYYLRQSTSMVQLMRVWSGVDGRYDATETARRQRLYCEVFVHERYMAIAHQQDVILPPLTTMPLEDPTIPRGVDHGFRQIIGLFSHVDTELLARHNNSETLFLENMGNWLERKHHAIQSEHVGNVEEDVLLSDVQLADIIITKHWLHMLLWQMAVSQFLLCSQTEEHPLSLLSPVRVSAQLRKVLSTVSRETVLIHGSSMQQKLFEITDTIASVIVTLPSNSEPELEGRLDDLDYLLGYLYSLPRLGPQQRRVLNEKLQQLQTRFPHRILPESPLSAAT